MVHEFWWTMLVEVFEKRDWGNKGKFGFESWWFAAFLMIVVIMALYQGEENMALKRGFWRKKDGRTRVKFPMRRLMILKFYSVWTGQGNSNEGLKDDTALKARDVGEMEVWGLEDGRLGMSERCRIGSMIEVSASEEDSQLIWFWLQVMMAWIGSNREEQWKTREDRGSDWRRIDCCQIRAYRSWNILDQRSWGYLVGNWSQISLSTPQAIPDEVEEIHSSFVGLPDSRRSENLNRSTPHPRLSAWGVLVISSMATCSQLDFQSDSLMISLLHCYLEISSIGSKDDYTASRLVSSHPITHWDYSYSRLVSRIRV